MAKSGGSSLMTLGLLSIGGCVAYEYFFAPSTAAAGSATPAGGGGAAAGAPVITGTWSDVYSRLIAAATPDTNFVGTGASLQGTPSRWNYYMSLVMVPGQHVANLPDLQSTFPGVDLNAMMTAATYFAGMAAALGAPLSALPIPTSATQSIAGGSTTDTAAGRAPGYAAQVQWLMDTNPVGTVAGDNHAPRGGGGTLVISDGALSGFGDVSCDSIDPTFMGPVNCTPTAQQSGDFIEYLQNAIGTGYGTPIGPTAAPSGLSTIPIWAWGVGAVGLLALVGSGGGRR